MKKYIKYLLVIIVSAAVISILAITFKKQKNQVEVLTDESWVLNQQKKAEDIISEGYSFKKPNIILNPFGNSPLTALIVFETENKVKPIIKIKGKDDNTSFIHEFNENTVHILPIYGLYPGKSNEISIQIGSEVNYFKIKTEKLPDDFTLPTKVYAEKSELKNDLYFFTKATKGYTSAYDVNGDVRWYLTSNALWDIEKLENGKILLGTERRVKDPYYVTGMYETDFLGQIHKEYIIEGGYHHDYFEMQNGNLLVASNDLQSSTVEDLIVELDINTGKIVKSFDLKTILKQDDAKHEAWCERDWFHNNSVWYDKQTNSIILSGRHQDAVISIDYDTGELNWIIGDSTNWSPEYKKYFFKPVGDLEWQWAQHAAMVTPEGYIFILDNGNNKSKVESEYVPAEKSYTRGVMYKIDTDKMTIQQIWQYGKERGSKFYSPYISDVDYLNKNHYLIHSGGISYKDGKIQNIPASGSGADRLVSNTVEILNDKVIFEIILPTNIYRAEKMNIYDENSEFKFSDFSVIGSLPKTKKESSKINIMLNSNDQDEEYKSKNIKLTSEIDRLVFNGDFNEKDSINIILYKNYISNKYKVQIKEDEHDAMCIDVFDDVKQTWKLNATKYINYTKLKGKYDVYVEINGKTYKTNQYININKKTQ